MKLKISPSHVFAPLMRLHNPDAVLLIRFAWRTRHVIDLFFVFCRHTDWILRVTTDDHRQRSGRQRACHLHIARCVRAVLTIVVMPHMGRRDNNVWLFCLLQLLNHQLRFISGLTKFDISEIFRITNFGCVIRRQANNGNFQILTLKQRPWFKQALAGTFLVDIGRK